MKKIVAAVVVFILLAVVFIYFYQKHSIILLDPMKAVPADAVFIVEADRPTESLQEFFTGVSSGNLRENPWLNDIAKDYQWLTGGINQQEELMEIFQKRSLVVSAHQVSATGYDYLFLMNLPQGWNVKKLTRFIEEKWNIKFTAHEYEGVKIYESKINDSLSFACAIHKSIGMFSVTPQLVEVAIRQLNHGSSITQRQDFKRVSISSGKQPGLHYFLNYNAFREIATNGFQKTFFNTSSTFASWSGLDVTTGRDFIMLKGNTSFADSSALPGAIRKHPPQQLHASSISPSSTALLLEYTHTSVSDLITSPQSVFLIITEPAGLSVENNMYLGVRTSNSKVDFDRLKTKSKAVQKYKGHTIAFIPGERLQNTFGELFGNLTNCYYTSLRDNIVFANHPAALKVLIDEVESGKVLSNDSLYRKESKRMMNTANVQLYVNPLRCENLFNSGQSNSFFRLIGGASAIHMQWTNAIPVSTQWLINFNKQVRTEPVLLFSVQLDTVIHTKPALMSGYIIVQDANYNLYKIDRSGKIIWKKMMDEAIMGSVHIVDMYNDGSRQILFNTSGKLYMLNANGSTIGNFPIRLPAPASNGLAVLPLHSGFQVVVACFNKLIYAYNQNGKPMPDWKYVQTEEIITNPVYSSTNGDKSYLVVSGSDTRIFDRRGYEVVSFKSKFLPAKRPQVELLNVDSNAIFTWIALDNDDRTVEFNSTGQYKFSNRVNALESSFPVESNIPTLFDESGLIVTGTADGLLNLYRIR